MNKSKKTKEAPEKQRKGFAVIPKNKGRLIASLGGKAAAKIPGHMALIGRIGGLSKKKKAA